MAKVRGDDHGFPGAERARQDGEDGPDGIAQSREQHVGPNERNARIRQISRQIGNDGPK